MLQREQTFPLALAAKAAVLNPPEGLEDCSWWPSLGKPWFVLLCQKIDIQQESLPDNVTLEDTKQLVLSFPTEDHPKIATALLTYTLLAPSVTMAQSPSIESPVSSAVPPQPTSATPKESIPTSVVYASSTRAFIAHTLTLLDIPLSHLIDAERVFSHELYNQIKESEMKEKSEKLRKEQESGWGGTWGRRIATAGGVTIGGVVLGLTGGLAAPAILPFVPFLTAASGPVILGSLFGLAGGGLTGYRVRRRWTGVEKFEFVEISGPTPPDASNLDSGMEKGKEVTRAPSIVATMLIPGIQLESENESITSSKKCLEVFSSSEQDLYVVSHSPDVMFAVGKTLKGWVMSQLMNRAGKEILKRTAFNAVLAAVAMPMTIYNTTGMAVDNDWIRAMDKARKAGTLLGEVIQERVQGNRPLMLIGTSMGGTTLFEALLYLANAKSETEAANPELVDSGPLVDSAIFISLPEAPNRKEWGLMRSVVGRRIVNAYCPSDLVLAGVGRLHEVLGGANIGSMAGLQAVDAETSSLYGIENVDLGNIIEGHFDLVEKMTAILRKIGLGESGSAEGMNR